LFTKSSKRSSTFCGFCGQGGGGSDTCPLPWDCEIGEHLCGFTESCDVYWMRISQMYLDFEAGEHIAASPDPTPPPTIGFTSFWTSLPVFGTCLNFIIYLVKLYANSHITLKWHNTIFISLVHDWFGIYLSRGEYKFEFAYKFIFASPEVCILINTLTPWGEILLEAW
jgi:hypothetical protein